MSGVRVEPMKVVLCMIVGAALVVMMSCTWDPRGATGLFPVSTVVIGMADVVSMFGAVVGYLKPLVSMAVPLHDPLVNGG